jgi:hypothetical protein
MALRIKLIRVQHPRQQQHWWWHSYIGYKQHYVCRPCACTSTIFPLSDIEQRNQETVKRRDTHTRTHTHTHRHTYSDIETEKPRNTPRERDRERDDTNTYKGVSAYSVSVRCSGNPQCEPCSCWLAQDTCPCPSLVELTRYSNSSASSSLHDHLLLFLLMPISFLLALDFCVSEQWPCWVRWVSRETLLQSWIACWRFVCKSLWRKKCAIGLRIQTGKDRCSNLHICVPVYVCAAHPLLWVPRWLGLLLLPVLTLLVPCSLYLILSLRDGSIKNHGWPSMNPKP